MRPSTLKRLERFNRAIDILKKIKEKRKEVFVSDLWLTSVAERNLQIATEFIIDISNLVISKLGLEIPENYRQTVERICKMKVIDKKLKGRAVDLIGLRNIIVHMYADIKYDLIFDELGTMITTLEKFSKDLLKFCAKKGIDP
jgi:uncharacterized protein YutE (UPF0331/DUF86 family)